ncbi:MAG: nitrite reductase small subunit NirD [Azonexus sp.]|nr:nitrite reductase small subunit NirD [Azonexus sp.]MCK6411062.1 nitrite reductase small subunit NirD [Azonexus sp.]
MHHWKLICPLEDIPRQGSRIVRPQDGDDIAVFRTADDAVFALHDKCPHKGGPLSQGLVHGHKVTCPLHGWNIGLEDGQAVAPDVGHCDRFEVKVENGQVYLAL